MGGQEKNWPKKLVRRFLLFWSPQLDKVDFDGSQNGVPEVESEDS